MKLRTLSLSEKKELLVSCTRYTREAWHTILVNLCYSIYTKKPRHSIKFPCGQVRNYHTEENLDDFLEEHLYLDVYADTPEILRLPTKSSTTYLTYTRSSVFDPYSKTVNHPVFKVTPSLNIIPGYLSSPDINESSLYSSKFEPNPTMAQLIQLTQPEKLPFQLAEEFI